MHFSLNRRSILLSGAILLTACGGGGGGTTEGDPPPTDTPSPSPSTMPTTAPTAMPTVVPTPVIDAIAPVANAGPDQTVMAGALVALDGRGSSDSDGQIVSYQWQRVGNGPALQNASSAQATFTASLPGAEAETYQYLLTVVDDQGLQGADTVSVTVQPSAVAFGDLRFILSWSTPGVDMDLYVTGADGEQIDFTRPGPSASGGELLNDDQGQGALVEEVRYPTPLFQGRYCALVSQSSGTDQQAFELTGFSGNNVIGSISGRLDSDAVSSTLAIEVGPSGMIGLVDNCGSTSVPTLE